MKVQMTKRRVLLITELPTTPDDISAMEINVGFVRTRCPTGYEGAILDHEIIPKIIKAVNAHEDLVSTILTLVSARCDCDTSIEKETGMDPSESNHPHKNALGEYIWGHECEFCKARRLVSRTGD